MAQDISTTKMNGHTYTSNVAKLLKHIDNLKQMQEGKPSPIMVHIIPTHKCKLNCVHCCFKNRVNKKADMTFEMFEQGIMAWKKLGVKAVEFTGGGDPTEWPHLTKAVLLLKKQGFKIGLITNGLGFDKFQHLSLLDWCRISLNTLDYRANIPNIELAKRQTHVSFCYIWNKTSEKNIDKVIRFAEEHKIVCRVAPDCVQKSVKIDAELAYIKSRIVSDWVFVSDFNIKTKRKNDNCYIHLIKPCMYLDGYVYACPSTELALENNKKVNNKYRICKIEDISKYYKNLEVKHFDCSYCKYVAQNELIEELLRKTEFNEFA